MKNLDGIPLRGIRFASAARGGLTAVLYLDASPFERQAVVAKRVALWIFSLESIPINAMVSATVNIEFEDFSMKGSVSGPAISLTAAPLKGNDGISKIVVTHRC
jgi:hypothetical protein